MKTLNKIKSLAELSPEIAKEWHPTKNGDLTPHDVRKTSGEKAWWLCENGHEWKTGITNRAYNKSSCPFCSGRKTTPDKSLAILCPELAKQWHPTKNGSKTPKEFSKGSNKKVWWLCYKRHEWEARVQHRANGSGCPICNKENRKNKTKVVTHKRKTKAVTYKKKTKVVLSNSLAILYPELAKQWHPTKNGDLTPNDFPKASSKKVWWKCDKSDDHEWEARISNRTYNERGCPFCNKKKTEVVPYKMKTEVVTFDFEQLKLLAHPTRFAIMKLLVDNEEINPLRIQLTLKTPQSQTSGYLTALKKGGLIKAKRDGKEVYYSLADPKIKELIKLISEL